MGGMYTTMVRPTLFTCTIDISNFDSVLCKIDCIMFLDIVICLARGYQGSSASKWTWNFVNLLETKYSW